MADQTTTTQEVQKQQPAPPARELSPVEKKFASMRTLLANNMKAITSALPAHMKPERLARIVMTTLQKNPKLLDCTQDSFVGCVMSCAALGLEPDGLLGQAYLIPFKEKGGRVICTMIPGYKGLIKLARQSGEIATIDAHEVSIGDDFEYRYGSDPMLRHRPAECPIIEKEGKKTLDPDWRPGEITHFYAVAKMKDGTCQFVVMQRWEVDGVRDGSQGYRYARDNGGDNPWITDYAEMGKKTAIRRGSKMWPASVDKDNVFQRLAALDEQQDRGVTHDMTKTFIDVDLVVQPTEAPTPTPEQEGRRMKLGGEPAKSTGDATIK